MQILDEASFTPAASAVSVIQMGLLVVFVRTALVQSCLFEAKS
jgi:hypothetical protein